MQSDWKGLCITAGTASLLSTLIYEGRVRAHGRGALLEKQDHNPLPAANAHMVAFGETLPL